MSTHYDFNILQERAKTLRGVGRLDDALRLYFFMADGDPSLDGGYLATQIGECYEKRGEFSAAKYWHGRAVEENPEVRVSSAEAVKGLEAIVNITDLIRT
jgi:tetratricopeptide (TPR) repeat protein